MLQHAAVLFESQSILLVDPDSEEACLIREVLQSERINNAVHVVTDGTEAVRYLSAQGPYADRMLYPLPCFILLDLTAPNGFELLQWVREHVQFRRMPVVVLTSTTEPEHISRMYALGANSYLIKPFDPAKLRELVKAINAYWVILVQKPTFR